ncbi:MAG: META domain-containing protein [Hyphomicrobiales bacterium]|nr:META domain-containing protein [Hyphomicrobiales bacterium]
MRKLAYLALAASAAVLLAQPVLARSKKPPANQGQQQDDKAKKSDEYEAPFPTKMTWNLTSMNGKPSSADASFIIDENYRGSGASGCNTWSAALYPVKGHRLAMGPVALTKKTCGAELANFERVFLTVLHSGPTWELQGSTLTVKSQYGTLVFDRGL